MACGWLTRNKRQHQMLEKMQKEGSCAHTAGGSQSATAAQSGRALEISVCTDVQFHYCSLGHLSQSNENLCSHKTRVWTFMEALVTIAQSWRQPRCPSTGGWLNKLWQSTPGMLCNNKNDWYRHKLGSIWRELCRVRKRDFKTLHRMISFIQHSQSNEIIEVDMGKRLGSIWLGRGMGHRGGCREFP